MAMGSKSENSLHFFGLGTVKKDEATSFQNLTALRGQLAERAKAGTVLSTRSSHAMRFSP